MMEYKRFVSYLYRYEGEQKERNAGFVRLEVRNRQCRIRIFMNHLPAKEPQTGEAWVFRQEGGKLELVPLGSFEVNAQAAEACFVTQADNFMDTGLPVTVYCGLAVFLGESGQLYLTAWDDTAVDLAELRRKLGEDGGAKEEPIHRRPEAVPEEEEALLSGSGEAAEKSARNGADLPAELSEIQEPQEPSAGEPELAATEWEEEAEVELIDLRREEEKTEHFRTLPPERFQVIPLTPRAGNGVREADAGTLSPDRNPGEEDGGFHSGGAWNLAAEAGARLWKKMLRAGARMMRRYDQKREELRAAEEAERAPKTAETGEREAASPELWQRLSRQLPHQLLFGSDDEREFLRLSLQDIGRLPSGYWELGRNPFLLHGYGRGRHLLLMHEKENCYLGVPGEDRERDRLAAELAGFTGILETKSGFYWIREMKE